MATRTWTGLGGNNNWSTSANWDAAIAPGDDLHFAGTTRLAPNNDTTADTSYNSITFDANAGLFVIGGNRITLTGNIICRATGFEPTINLNIILNVATCTMDDPNNDAQNMHINGIISETGGSRSITKNGNFSVLMGVDNVALVNTYSGGTVITKGTVFGSQQNNSIFGTGPILIASTGGVRFRNQTISNSIIATGGVITFDNGTASNVTGSLSNSGSLTIYTLFTTNTFSGPISGSGTFNLIDIGSGNLSFSGTNTFTGTVNLSCHLSAGSTQAFGSGATFVLDNAANTELNITGFNNSIGSIAGGGAAGGNVVLGAATLTIGGNNTSTTYDGVISGTGGVTKSGTGTFTLSRANTYTGATTINAGNLSVTGSLASGSAATVNTTGKLSGTGTVSGTTSVAAGGKLGAGIQ